MYFTDCHPFHRFAFWFGVYFPFALIAMPRPGAAGHGGARHHPHRVGERRGEGELVRRPRRQRGGRPQGSTPGRWGVPGGQSSSFPSRPPSPTGGRPLASRQRTISGWPPCTADCSGVMPWASAWSSRALLLMAPGGRGRRGGGAERALQSPLGGRGLICFARHAVTSNP